MKNLFVLLPVLLLSACGDTQHAAYLIGGAQHSLTLTRQQDFVGSEWTTELVVARFPECQRRFPLTDMVGDNVKMDVYRPEPGVFILKSGKRWYVAETKTCRFEQFKAQPPEPGDLIGGFLVKNGQLEYKNLEEKKPAPASASRP